MAPVKNIEYMCTWCGKKTIRLSSRGRPEPGNCPRKSKDAKGHNRPHTWVINRK